MVDQEGYRAVPISFPTRDTAERMTIDVGVWDMRPSNTTTDAPLVMALHGVPGSSQDFDLIGRELVTHGIRFVGLDLPGFGKSRLFDQDIYRLDHSTEGKYQMLTTIVDALQISRIDVLMSHSAGTWLGYKAAGELDRVKSALFLNPLGARPHRTIRPWPATVLMGALVKNRYLHSSFYRLLPHLYKYLGFVLQEDSYPSLPVAMETIANADFDKMQSYAEKAAMRKHPFVMMITRNDKIGESSISMEMAHFMGLQEGEITEISRDGTTTVGESVGKHDSICFRRVLLFERGGHVAQKAHVNEIIEHTQQLINVVNKKS